jgi:hypothetical protein
MRIPGKVRLRTEIGHDAAQIERLVDLRAVQSGDAFPVLFLAEKHVRWSMSRVVASIHRMA